MRILIFSTLTLLLMSCGASKISTKNLSGNWTMDRVYKQRVNVTTLENPNQDRFIEFQSDGTYRSGGEPYGPVSGVWEVLPDNVLQITPKDNDEVGESTWKVTFDKDHMVWRGTGNAELEGYVIHWMKG